MDYLELYITNRHALLEYTNYIQAALLKANACTVVVINFAFLMSLRSYARPLARETHQGILLLPQP